MIVLNLGCGHATEAVPGAFNLDRNPKYGDRSGWVAERGLPQFADGAVDAVTISHLLMYIKHEDQDALFAEVARVLKPGGVVRITEDIIDHPASRHWRGHEPRHSSWSVRVSLLSPPFLRDALRRAGIVARTVAADETRFDGPDLRQDRHNEPRATDRPGMTGPHVYYVEGVKA